VLVWGLLLLQAREARRLPEECQQHDRAGASVVERAEKDKFRAVIGQFRAEGA
jgi:hypothetical protein